MSQTHQGACSSVLVPAVRRPRAIQLRIVVGVLPAMAAASCVVMSISSQVPVGGLAWLGLADGIGHVLLYIAG